MTSGSNGARTDAFGPTTKVDTRESGGPGAARVRLRAFAVNEQVNPFLDGGWWPHSTDLMRELPPLLEAVAAAGFDTHRVVYGPHNWDHVEDGLPSVIGSHPVSLDRYARQPPDTIGLVDRSGSGRLELLVLPPDSDPAFAERALAIAARDGDPDPAGEVLDRAAEAL